jgi:hypothetical protein
MRLRAYAHRCAQLVRWCVRECALVCLRAFVSAVARAGVCAFLSAKQFRACVHSTCLCVFVCSERVCAPALCGPSRGHGGALCGVDSPACVRPRGACGLGSPVGSRAHGWPAGVTWASRTACAPWEARQGHTSVVDAISGAIYVIGGLGGDDTPYLQDVWVSTDGGARTGRARGGSGRCVMVGNFGGTTGVLPDTTGVPMGTHVVLRGKRGVPEGYPAGFARGIHGRVQRGAPGYSLVGGLKASSVEYCPTLTLPVLTRQSRGPPRVLGEARTRRVRALGVLAYRVGSTG